MAVQLTINVSQIEQVMQSFNVVRIKRSTTGINGIYSLITDNTPQPARMEPPVLGPWSVVSKTLQLKVDSTPQVDIIFTGVDPLSAAHVAPQINDAVGALIATEVGGLLKLASTITGTASKLVVVGGGAAPVFGWTDGQWDIGEDAHLQLVPNTNIYNYIDNDGQPGHYYKAQFYNTDNGLESQDSLPFQGAASTVVGADKLSLGKIDLVDGAGVAVPEFEVTFYVIHEPFEVDGFQVALARKPITVKTDNGGHAEINLVRGLKVKVVFEGTSLIRTIQVPDAPEFNLLELLGTAPDPFNVAALTFPAAPRRSI